MSRESIRETLINAPISFAIGDLEALTDYLYEKNYVRLAEDQSWPEPPNILFPTEHTVWCGCIDMARKDGFRRVVLDEGK